MNNRLRFLITVLIFGLAISALSWFKSTSSTYTYCDNVKYFKSSYHGFPLDYYGGSNASCFYHIDRGVGMGVSFGVPGNYYIAPGNSLSIGPLLGDIIFWSLLAALVTGSYKKLIKIRYSPRLRKK